MQVAFALDKFAETLTAAQASAAVASGWAQVRPVDQIRTVPMSDGGTGFAAVLADALPGCQQLLVPATDPLGREVLATVVVHEGSAYIESAQALGLHLLAQEERNPEQTSSAGLAALLDAAVTTEAPRIVVGLGGSATADGGRGLLAALEADHPGVLACLRRRERTLIAACDVMNPLLGPAGATLVFAPQKGASQAAVRRLEEQMHGWVQQQPGLAELAQRSGAGAAGGVGAALLWLGAQCVEGAGLVAAAAQLPAVIAESDLVITGEGSYDSTSLRGKVVGQVASLAQAAAVPCAVIAGQLNVGRREAGAHGVVDMLGLSEVAGSIGAAKASARAWAFEAGRVMARRWAAV